VAAALVVVVVVILVIAVSSHSDSGKASHSGTPGSISGSTEQWVEAVCRTGTFADRNPPPDAEGGALCMPKSGSGVITIGQYDSNFKMRNAIAMLQAKYYASAITSDETVWVFAVMAGDASILEPLTQFGFRINTASPR